MKLIEAMKRIRVIEKRMDANTQRIQQYASAPSNEKPYFNDERTQKTEVQSLIQANTDLVNEYLKLKKQVDMTNLVTKITIGKDSYTIADLLILRRGLSKLMQKTFVALNDSIADAKISSNRRMTPVGSGEKAPYTVRFYDEREKFEQIQALQARDDEIEQRIEVINATTELVTF